MREHKFTTNSFIDSKKNGEKISMLTAYDYSTAKLLDESGVDTILVGDSLGMVMLGYENTLQVTIEDMLHHCRAVKRGVKKAFVIGDMPFMTYHTTVENAIINAGRFIQEAGVDAVKLEGGRIVKDKIEGIIRAQIPVVGHLGLTPQSVNMMGGFKVQGKDEAKAKELIEDALMLEEIGCVAIVLECVPEKLARIISEKVSIPTIGIGAGNGCDGQVLVIQDMLGMYSDFVPKFVKRFGDIGPSIKDAVRSYIEEVKSGAFPEEKHTFKINDDVLEKLY